MKRKRPILIHASWLPFGLRGFCLPPLVAVRMDQVKEPWVLRHELVHYLQYKRRGWTRYVAGYLWHLIRRGYHRHPWEVEARRRGWKPRTPQPCRKCAPLFETQTKKRIMDNYITAQDIADLRGCTLKWAYKVHLKIRKELTPAQMMWDGRTKGKLTIKEYCQYECEDFPAVFKLLRGREPKS